MAGLLSLLRLDPMFSIYQKIASGAQKTAPAPRYDGLIEIDDFSIPVIFTHTVMALRVTACLLMKNYRHLVDLPAYLSCQDPR